MAVKLSLDPQACFRQSSAPRKAVSALAHGCGQAMIVSHRDAAASRSHRLEQVVAEDRRLPPASGPLSSRVIVRRIWQALRAIFYKQEAFPGCNARNRFNARHMTIGMLKKYRARVRANRGFDALRV